MTNLLLALVLNYLKHTPDSNNGVKHALKVQAVAHPLRDDDINLRNIRNE